VQRLSPFFYGWSAGAAISTRTASGITLWKYHPAAFGEWGRTSAGGSQINVYDVSGDGVNDVVTAMQAHGWGLAWFEQKRSSSGEISFVKHVIGVTHRRRAPAGWCLRNLTDRRLRIWMGTVFPI
jgi:hypothetical protein